MATWLRQSTAVDIPLGPFVDATDGVTAETGLTLSQADIRLKKNAGAWAQVNDNTAATHEENGWYEKELNATDTDTLGTLIIAVNESGAAPVWREFMVVPANVWDSFLASDKLQVHVDEMTAGIVTATVIATGAIDADAIADNAIDAGAIAADAITAAKIADGAIDAGTFAASAITATAIAADAITAAKIADGAIDANTFAANAITATAIASDAITAAKIADGAIDAGAFAADAITAAKLAADVTTELQSGLATAASISALDGKIDVIDDFLDTEIAAIAADTDDIQSRLPAALVGGRMDSSVGAMASGVMTAAAAAADFVDEIWDDVVEGSITARQFLRGFGSALLGKLSGGGTATEIFRDASDTKARITATVDSSGNRTAISLDLT